MQKEEEKEKPKESESEKEVEKVQEKEKENNTQAQKDLNTPVEQVERQKHKRLDTDPESVSELNKMGELKLKNGCCRNCMKAFSKLGKSCLCQVPRLQRRATLPINGCKFCGCRGCNPIDIRRDKRQDIKRILKDQGKYYSKRQRLLDSDDEELLQFTDADKWNPQKKEFSKFLTETLNSPAVQFIFSVPMRTPSYILGAHHKWISEDEYKSMNL